MMKQCLFTCVAIILLSGTTLAATHTKGSTKKLLQHRGRNTVAMHKLKIQRDSASVVVHLNLADAKALQRLKGIGAKRAAAIIKYPQEHGPFAAPASLANVPGVGAKGWVRIDKSNPKQIKL